MNIVHMAKRIRITISLDGNLAKRVERLARAARLSFSRQIELFVHDAVADSEMAVKVLSDPVLSQYVAKAFGNRDFIRGLLEQMKEDASPEQMKLVFEGISSIAANEPGASPVPAPEPVRKKRGKRK